MASIKYSIQSRSDSASIYLRLSMGRSNYIKCRIGLAIDANNWSDKTGLPKQNNTDNKSLANKLLKLN